MNLKSLWLAWRKDILRVLALCVAALVVGLAINSAVGGFRTRVASYLPTEVGDALRSNFDPDFNAGPRQTGETWTYHGRIAPRQWVWIKNTNGSVQVEAAAGDSLEVTAVKTYRRSDPGTVRLVATPFGGGVTICALWGSGEGRCGPGDRYKQGMVRRNDVAVQFTVKLPRGVKLGATTVSGAVRIAGATAPVVAATVNGEVEAETTNGPVSAVSVNGSIRARMSGFADTGAVKLVTVNGAVTAELPARLDANVEANTVNGSIDTDYPLTVSGKFTSHHVSGTVGAGGRRVAITTVNGSINLRKVL